MAALKEGLSHNRPSSENNPMILPLHCGQHIVLLPCSLKKVNIFLMGNSYENIPPEREIALSSATMMR
jgi:hypothetical protein